MIRTAIYSEKDTKTYRDNGNDWNFHGENTQQHLHALHPYPARFIPQIPRKAVLTWTNHGDTVLDPFCGCGTTILESTLNGRQAIGIDNNGVACLISRAKVADYSQDDLESLKSLAITVKEVSTSDDWKEFIPNYNSLSYWFDEVAIKDLAILKFKINGLHGNAKLMAMAVLSSIIVRVSYQDSDTRYSRQLQHYNEGAAISWFQTKLVDSVSRIGEIINLPKAKSQIHLADSRDFKVVPKATVDLIVTSPPYLNAYDYHKYHRHRLHWTEADVAYARDNEIGKHDVFTRPNAKPDKYFEDMENCFKEWQRVLRANGKALVVIGDAIVSGSPVFVADEFVKLCDGVGLKLADRWIRKLDTNKKSFNQAARINEEHLLLFVKSI